jgi:purine nucleosidase
LRLHLFETQKARVFVEYESELCMGQTIADWYGKSGLEPNADIVTRVDADGVIDLSSWNGCRVTHEKVVAMKAHKDHHRCGSRRR